MSTVYCSVDSCNSEVGQGLSFFRCPKDEARCQSWKNALGFTGSHRYANITANQCYSRIKICSLHFSEECYRNKNKLHLKYGVIPSLMLPFSSDQAPSSSLAVNKFGRHVSVQTDAEEKIFIKHDASESSEESEKETDSSPSVVNASTQTEWNKQSMEDKTYEICSASRKKQRGKRKFAELEKSEITLPDVLKFIEENYPTKETNLIKTQLLTLGNHTKRSRKRATKAMPEVVITKEIENQTASLKCIDSTTLNENINSHSNPHTLRQIEIELIKIEPVELLDPAKVKTEKDDPEFEDPHSQKIHFTSDNISNDFFLGKNNEEIKTEYFDDNNINERLL